LLSRWRQRTSIFAPGSVTLPSRKRCSRTSFPRMAQPSHDPPVERHGRSPATAKRRFLNTFSVLRFVSWTLEKETDNAEEHIDPSNRPYLLSGVLAFFRCFRTESKPDADASARESGNSSRRECSACEDPPGGRAVPVQEQQRARQ